MNISDIYELIGYAASVLVVLSLMMSSVIKLRLLNLSGAVGFLIYGILIGSVPVALVNVCVIGVNSYYLYGMFTAREYLKILEIDINSEYLGHFLDFYRTDIESLHPSFDYSENENGHAYLILRNLVPAGLLIIVYNESGDAVIQLDYVIPGYRDFKAGKFIFIDNKKFFTDRKIRRIVARAGNKKHEKYLRRMGFLKSDSEIDGNNYSLILA